MGQSLFGINEEKTMKQLFNMAIILSSAAMLATSCSHHHKKKTVSLTNDQIAQQAIDNRISSWPEASKRATKETIGKYGFPQYTTDEVLVWNDVHPYKRIMVFKEEITHDFPKHHTDVIEHVVDYRVPNGNKISQAWKFDGSVVFARTKGEMSARCDREAFNVLALNLADQVIHGKLSANKARMEYGREVLSYLDGNSVQYTDALAFVPSINSADPDHSIEDQLLKENRMPKRHSKNPKLHRQAQEAKE
jgi:hypothetical protein